MQVALTLSILQLAIYSNVEILNVACPIEVRHYRVIVNL
jgi:hypothetical protein